MGVESIVEEAHAMPVTYPHVFQKCLRQCNASKWHAFLNSTLQQFQRGWPK
jgi:hypothetical protein